MIRINSRKYNSLTELESHKVVAWSNKIFIDFQDDKLVIYNKLNLIGIIIIWIVSPILFVFDVFHQRNISFSISEFKDLLFGDKIYNKKKFRTLKYSTDDKFERNLIKKLAKLYDKEEYLI